MKNTMVNNLQFYSAILAAVIIAGGSIYVNYSNAKAKIHHELLAKRKDALFQALQVIDLVYANTDFSGMPPARGRKWDIQLAREAMNRMVIYCKDPDKTVRSFMQAIGLHNQRTESPPTYSAGNIHDFRKEAARELELPEVTYEDSEKTWIYSLPGTEEYELMKRSSK